MFDREIIADLLVASSCNPLPSIMMVTDIFKCLFSVVCQQMFVFKCLFSNVCFQMFVFKCLSSNVCFQMFVFKCLFSNVCFQFFVLKCLSSNVCPLLLKMCLFDQSAMFR